MSDALTVDQVYKIRDEKIVDGYIRTNFTNSNTHFPKEIINLCFKFYHIVIRETFKHYNPNDYQLSNNDMTVSFVDKGGNASICYGSLCIPSLDSFIYSWKFKILQRTSHICIGIGETKYVRKYDGHFNDGNYETKYYALWHDGDKNRWDHAGIITKEDSTPTFTQNDSCCMTLDLSNRTLSYQINDGEKYVAFKNVTTGHDIEYCMGVYIWANKDCIELLSCKKSQ